MADLEAQVQLIKRRIEKARVAQVSAEYEHARAEEATKLAAQLLKDEFSVGSLDEAKELYGRLEGEVAAEVSRVEAALAIAERTQIE